ncbi:fumarylacetoacetate hydrolase family protein [Nocardia miyunensis]|uniref:fumarylacetoacetate hydrolase family protein n=1 Tax=Nocardia miyunensis TaxID=282684 RepID=UPI00082B17EA|nr:fumarylacetoacetate hydrolase family protein [Nocardia miyunensis]
MKLLYFDDFRLGVLKDGDSVVDIDDVVASVPRARREDVIVGVIEQFAQLRAPIEEFVARSSGVPLESVRVRPPLPRPANFVCMHANYLEYGTRPEPPRIDAFLRSANTIIGHGDTMVMPDEPLTIFEGEAELAVVIGKPASHVSEADALDHVFGYLNFIDGSARGLGGPRSQIYRRKSRETFAPIGPYLVTADEIPDPQNVDVKLWNNGTLFQDFNTDDMAYSIAKCIEWVSSIHPLEPGDILATGTNHGGLNPFQNGDVIELECAGLGRLKVRVRDDLEREWKRESRAQRKQQGLEGQTPQINGKYTPAVKGV